MKQHKNKKRIIIVLILLVLVVACIVGIWIHSMKKKQEDNYIDTKEEVLEFLNQYYHSDSCEFKYVKTTDEGIIYECVEGKLIMQFTYNIDKQKVSSQSTTTAEVTANTTKDAKN